MVREEARAGAGGESTKPMAPAFGLLQDQVPIAVLKQLVSISSPPPLLRDALVTARLVPCGLGNTAQFSSWLHHSGQYVSLFRGHLPAAVGDAAEGNPDGCELECRAAATHVEPGAEAVPLGLKLPTSFPPAEAGPCCAETWCQHKKCWKGNRCLEICLQQAL